MSTDPHRIHLKDAVILTKQWRDNHPGSMKAGRFDRIAFDRLLAQEGAAGIRIYLGEKADGSWTFVMVGTDSAGSDIVQEQPAANSADDPPVCPPIEEETYPCPPYCDCDSPLNGDCP